ncbi:MAG: NAD(P)-dependent oxidoreductase [Burkholderiaceae bacterium]
MLTTGVIGAGAMGAGIATRLINTGHQVFVRDIRTGQEEKMAQAGATVAADAGSVLRLADTVFVVVVTADQIDDVLVGQTGLLAALSVLADPKAKTILLCSTIAPADTIRLAGKISELGAAVIDAPISGGPARAYDGSMSIMLAGSADDIARNQLVIDAVAERQFRISEHVGDGAKAKLVNNLAGGIHLAAAAEALAMADRLGLDLGLMQKLMSASSGQSWVADDRMPRALAGDFEPRAATRVLTKDLTLAAQVAKQAGISLPLGSEALNRFRAACEAGYAEQDDAAMLKYYRGL